MIGRLLEDRVSLVSVGVILLFTLTSFAFGFPAPPGIVFLGLVIGSLISFISIGIVLIYRTNRIINFAGADIGAVAAVLSVLLVGEAKMNYFLAVGIGLITALLLGALIEFAVVRRFFKAPRLILTVATIGLTQLLVFIEVILPRAFNLDFVSVSIPTPFDFGFSIPDPLGATTPVRFDGNHLLAIIAVPIVVGGLGLFLRYTSIGVAARGAADNAERAALLGIPVKRISTIVWILAAGLSAIGSLLRAPTVGLSITGGAFGPFLLVRAITPAVVGRMENLRATFLAALALGVVDQSIYFRFGNPAITHLILFLVILAALLIRRGSATGSRVEEGASTWQAIKEIRPVPQELRAVPEVRYGIPVAFALLVLAMVAFGIFGSGFRVGTVSLIMIYGIIGASLVILTGWAGQISLGQVAFVAVGAAVTAMLVAEKGWNLLLALLVAGLVGAISAAIIGLPALRIRGLFLAASSLAFGLFVSSMVLNPTYFGWLLPDGYIDRPILFGFDLNSDRTFYFLVLIVLILVLASIRRLRRSRTGRVLIGSRDNERAARAFGITVTRAKLTAFSFSGFYAAVAGGLYAMSQNGVNASALGVEKSLQVFVMVVIGGLGSIPGAMLGAAYYFGTQFFLSGAASLLASGLGMLILLMIVPGGLGQIMYGWRDALLRWIAKRRGIVVPSLVADVRVDQSILLPGSRRDSAEQEAVELQLRPEPAAEHAGST